MPASPPDDGSRHVWAILAGLAATMWMMAAAFAIVGSMFIARTDAGRSWPTTEGVIVRNAVSESEYRDPKDGYTKIRFHSDLAYSYDVDGHPYEGHDYDVTGATDWDAMKRFVSESPPGTRVQVHYDPADPSASGLTTEGSVMGGVFVGIAVFTGAVGLVLAFFSVRSRMRRRRA